MANITTFDWMPLETEAPTRQSVGKEYRREEEFRRALDSYIADYQKHRAVTIGNTGYGTLNTHLAFFSRFTCWIRR